MKKLVTLGLAAATAALAASASTGKHDFTSHSTKALSSKKLLSALTSGDGSSSVTAALMLQKDGQVIAITKTKKIAMLASGSLKDAGTLVGLVATDKSGISITKLDKAHMASLKSMFGKKDSQVKITKLGKGSFQLASDAASSSDSITFFKKDSVKKVSDTHYSISDKKSLKSTVTTIGKAGSKNATWLQIS